MNSHVPKRGLDAQRRHLLQGGFALAMLGLPKPARAQSERLAGGADVTAELQREIDAAAKRGRAFLMPAGTMHVARLRLHTGARLIGVRGESRMVLVGEGPLVIAEGVERVTLTGIVFDGAGRTLEAEQGLVDCAGVDDILMSDCVFQSVKGIALRLRRCGGWIERNTIRDIAGIGVSSIDNAGLVIADNIVQRCIGHGIQVQRAAPGDVGTHVKGNRILDIEAGGAGPGNGLSLSRADGMSASGNTIRRCAGSAVRNAGGRNVVIAGNDCADIGETAIVAEDGFAGCVVANNVIDGALAGIRITGTAEAPAQGATCSANVIRNLRPSQDHAGHASGYETGISVEADAAVTGNLVEGAPWVGILAGWGASLRNVIVSGNIVRGAPIGIGVSVAKGVMGAIVGMTMEKASTGDLAAGAAAPATLAIDGNRAM